jgi:hypothetical protein
MADKSNLADTWLALIQEIWAIPGEHEFPFDVWEVYEALQKADEMIDAQESSDE